MSESPKIEPRGTHKPCTNLLNDTIYASDKEYFKVAFSTNVMFHYTNI